MNGNWSDYEKYLKPIHLHGEPRTLTITRITEEETHPRPTETVRNPVLWFKEMPFGLILSPTNRATLIALYGDAVRDSIGKPITVQAVPMKVAGKDKQPIRILKTRPVAAHIEPATGEIVPPASPEAEGPTPASNEGQSELDAFFDPRQEQQILTPNSNSWPSTEAEFLAWLKANDINGKETRSALGTDAKSWIKMNAGKSWLDVAQTIAAALGKGAIIRSFPLNHTTEKGSERAETS